jgi:hypothetical protein
MPGHRYGLTYSIYFHKISLMLTSDRCLKTLIFALFCSTAWISCQKDPISTVDCTGVTPTYSSDIKPILDTNCATSGCHNSGSKQAGIDLSNYPGAKNISSQDRFLGAIRHTKGFVPMPQNSSKLNVEKIELIDCWVQNGAVE